MTAAALVLPASFAAVPVTGTTASVAEPSPAPTGPDGQFESFEVSPGLLGFLPPFLIAVACVGLFLSLTRHLRRVNVRQAQLDAAQAAADDGPGDLGGPRDDGRDRPGGPR